MKIRKAFTLIELLVVIAIIAILAAILFPVFTQAKNAAKLSKGLSQMRQLGISVMLYASDADDNFVPASMRNGSLPGNPVIWTQGVLPYVKNKEIFSSVGADSGFAENWATRRVQSIGMNDATGVDPISTVQPGAAGPGTEAFATSLSFGALEQVSKSALFTSTPNGPAGDMTSKHRGYVFNPYNGNNDPAGYQTGLPLISDLNLVTVNNDVRYPNSSARTPGQLKPVFARYSPDGKGNGRTPVIFGDGHAATFSANQLNAFGTVIWRLR